MGKKTPFGSTTVWCLSGVSFVPRSPALATSGDPPSAVHAALSPSPRLAVSARLVQLPHAALDPQDVPVVLLDLLVHVLALRGGGRRRSAGETTMAGDRALGGGVSEQLPLGLAWFVPPPREEIKQRAQSHTFLCHLL